MYKPKTLWIGLALVFSAAVFCILPAVINSGPQPVRYTPASLPDISILPVRIMESERYDFNKADAGELVSIRGIGPVLAERIISERKENGDFFYPEDLLAVRGIGISKLKDITRQTQIQTDGGQ